MQSININSETGHLEGVIIHTPGPEVEKMTPQNVERALYSDILNLSVAAEEYTQFKTILKKQCNTFEVKDLLTDVFSDTVLKHRLLNEICTSEGVPELLNQLENNHNRETARQLIEGVEIQRDNLTRYLSDERYSLKPLHNFFFTRDASMCINNKVVTGCMASNVRLRETVIMEAILGNHTLFRAETLNAAREANRAISPQIKIEGGDILVARHNVLLAGCGVRTSTSGIDFLIETFKKEKKEQQHIIVQELPDSPESFIHLDMVFTLLDQGTCMVYEPLIMAHNRFRTIHICIENGKVASIKTLPGLLQALKSVGVDLEPVKCGGDDTWHQEREQWHSGANFFALKPGVILGYERNKYTAEALNNKGFDVISAKKLIEEDLPIPDKKTLITIAGAELARGGGGARCMSMPYTRKDT